VQTSQVALRNGSRHTLSLPASTMKWALTFLLCAAYMASAAPAGGSQVAGARPASEHPDAVAVIDDTGREVVLPRPARRVVALTPALTELAFAAGGGDRLVGVVDGSDYPPAARALPR